MLRNILSLLFAPLFVLCIHYFEFQTVVLVYLVISIVYFIYTFIKKIELKELLVPSIYVGILSIAYYFSSFQSVKYIPVILSSIFLLMFIDAHLNQRWMILGFTKRFYTKELSVDEIKFLKQGDAYWVVVMLINTMIHLYIVNFCTDTTWALYSSVGWYVLFFVSLIAQIIYGKL